jgi:hypothetical protein
MRLKTILNFRKGSWQKLSNKKKKREFEMIIKWEDNFEI